MLIQANPEGVFELLTREEARGYLLNHGVPAGILKKRKWFTTAHWTTLVTLLADQPSMLPRCWMNAPSSRQAMFDAAYPEAERKTRVFPTSLLDVLPHQLRDKEASRMLELREIRDDQYQTFEITTRRLIGHTRADLEGSVQVSNADERALAYRRLIQSTILSRRGMDDTLHFLTRIKNDQDPVRFAAISELSNSPAHMFKEEHIEDLTVLIDSVVEARDTSYGTKNVTERLAFDLLREHALEPESKLFRFALRTFERMVMRVGSLYCSPKIGIAYPVMHLKFF